MLQCVHCFSFLGSAKQPQTREAPAPPPKVDVPQVGPAGEFRPDETRSGSAILPDLPRAMQTPTDAGGDLHDDAEILTIIEDDLTAPPLDTVFTVEDSSVISAILNDMLVVEGLTRRVMSCKNGYEFLGRFFREHKAGISAGLVVMDVMMPVLNGISSAVALRAYEKGRELDPVPILFFTSKRCDETFRKVLVHCAPAMYINKGTSTSPAHLKDRIRKVIRQLLREEW